MPLPVPPSIEQLGERPFSFYPAILGVDHNEWTFRRATWSEMLVSNRTTKEEIWIPRRYVGEVSRIDEPMVIIGLLKELEYRGGMVVPHERRVIEIPRAVNDFGRSSETQPARPAPVTGIRLEGGTESRVGRMLFTAVAIGLVLCIVIVAILSTSGKRVSYHAVLQNDLGFAGNDDYFAIVNKLGPPAEEKWRSDEGTLQYRRLSYPAHSISLILMGPDRRDMHYIGAMDPNWHVVHSVDSNAAAMLRNLKRF